MDKTIKQYFEFATFIEALKKMERFRGQFYWKDYPQLSMYESVADHTWRLGILIILFEKQLEEQINIGEALKMTLVHDLPEIIAGDASPMGSNGKGDDSHAYNKLVAKERRLSEEEAAKKLFEILPRELGEDLFKTWVNYENQETYTAKVVKALDRIECMLQVLEYRQGNMFPEHLEFTINYGLEKAFISKEIQKFGDLIAFELRSKFTKFVK